MSRQNFSPAYEEPVPDTFGKGPGVVGPVFFVHNSVKNVDDRFEPTLAVGIKLLN
jgi:hypothetical protein